MLSLQKTKIVSAGCSSPLFTPTRDLTGPHFAECGRSYENIRSSSSRPTALHPEPCHRRGHDCGPHLDSLCAGQTEPWPKPWASRAPVGSVLSHGGASLPSAKPRHHPRGGGDSSLPSQAAAGPRPSLQLPPGQRRETSAGESWSWGSTPLGHQATSRTQPQGTESGQRVAETTFHVLVCNPSPSITWTCQCGGRNPKADRLSTPHSRWGRTSSSAQTPMRRATPRLPRPRISHPSSRSRARTAIRWHSAFQRQPLNFNVFLPSISQFTLTPTPGARLRPTGACKEWSKGAFQRGDLAKPSSVSLPPSLESSRAWPQRAALQGEGTSSEFRRCLSRVHLFRLTHTNEQVDESEAKCIKGNRGDPQA